MGDMRIFDDRRMPIMWRKSQSLQRSFKVNKPSMEDKVEDKASGGGLIRRFLRRRSSLNWKSFLKSKGVGDREDLLIRNKEAEKRPLREVDVKVDGELLESLKQRLTLLESAAEEKGKRGQSDAVNDDMATQLQALEQRVITLETNNKALTTIVLPTLMRLVKEAATTKPQKSTITTITPSTTINSNTFSRKKSSSSSPSSTTSSSRHRGKLGGGYNYNADYAEIDMSSAPRVPSTSPPHMDPPTPPPPLPPSQAVKSTPTKSSSIGSTRPSRSNKKSSSVNSSNAATGIPRMTHPPRSSPSRPPFITTAGNSGIKEVTPITPKFKTPGVSRLPVFKKTAGSPSSKRQTTSTVTTTVSKPLPLQSKAKGDEGYSTMSSEALADQPPTQTAITNPTNKTSLLPSPSKATGIPKSSTFSTSPSSKNPSGVASGSLPHQQIPLVCTASVLQPTEITTTPQNVRIVHGSPYEIRLSRNLENSLEENSNSMSTVLWEDSDDSDILFMPIELSEDSDSTSTIKGESYTKWTTNSGSTSAGTGSSSGGGGRGRGGPSTIPPPPQELVGGSLGETEQSFVEKWMRLEDVRNEEATWDEHWAWDWDGVLNHHPKGSHFHPNSSSPASNLPKRRSISPSKSPGRKTPEIDSSTWTKSTRKKFLQEQQNQKEKKKEDKNHNESLIIMPVAEEEVEQGPPPPIEFSVEFYRLASYGSSTSFGAEQGKHLENKQRPSSFLSDEQNKGLKNAMIQTESLQSSTDESAFMNSDLFAQCQNCLEVISKLVTTDNPTKSEGDKKENEYATIDSLRGKKEGLKSTWLKVPKGYKSSQVESYLQTLSSSESEEALCSPSK